MKTTTYHEKVARAMVETFSVGSMNSYEKILETLLRKLPDEEELRAFVEHIEQKGKDQGIITDPDWHMVPEDHEDFSVSLEFQCSLCGRVLDKSKNQGNGKCIYCLAELGNLDCHEILKTERESNAGYLDIDVVLVCPLPQDVDPVLAGCTSHKCHKCETAVMVAPSPMNTCLDEVNRTKGKLYFICMKCAPLSVGQLAILAVERLQRAAKSEKPFEKPEPPWANDPNFVDAPDGRGGFAPVDEVLAQTVKDKIIGNQEPGAIINGRKVRKVNAELHDRTPAGTIGTVLGSISKNGFPIFIEGKVVHYGYLILWEGEELPVFTTNLKVEEL